MLKVWSTEALWQIIYDTMQIYGGKAFFLDQPLERWMRDARLNQIGEGSNDVLRPFIAMVGIKPVADHLLSVKDALQHPWSGLGKLLTFGGGQLRSRLSSPAVPVQSAELQEPAAELGRRVRDFGLAVQATLFANRKDPQAFLFRQLVQERLANAACELYASSCTLSRLDHLLSPGNGQAPETARDVAAGRHFLRLADRRVRESLAALKENDDADVTATANTVLR
jgi:hypothetical protein